MPSQTIFKSSLQIEVKAVVNLSDIKPHWSQLEKYATNIFLSWTWIGSWLSAIKNKSNVFSLHFHDNTSKLVGMAFLISEKTRRRKIFKLNIISLNETVTNDTQFIIEYNNILHNPDYRDDIYLSLFDFLKNGSIKFDELQLNAFDLNNAPNIESIARSNNFHYLCEKTSKANFVNLSEFTENPDHYLPTLSKNKREQIRRSIRFYEKYGEFNMNIATDKEQAMKYFDALGCLHQTYWIGKGHSGSFSNEAWVEFHKHLISNNLNNTQLIKLSYGDHTVGYLYNLVDNSTVYSMQSGFNYGEDKNDRPGLVSHYYAIRHAISIKRQKYDFLVGDNQYKRSLSNADNTCSWIQIQNNTFPIRMENMTVHLYRFMKNTLKSITGIFPHSIKTKR